MMVIVNDMLMITRVFCFFLLCFPFICSARDNITWNSSITDFQRETLVSAGGRFELGFFTPNGSLYSRRYVGIWYYRSNPRTVVWVANRENPLGDSNGVFAIAEDGNAKVLDRNNNSYWSTHRGRNLSYINRTLKLLDSGNLVLMEEDRISHTVMIWQSFDHPTDTFLPGMKMDANLVLTSWRSIDDPGPGHFTFQKDQNQYIIRNEGSIPYWQSKVSGDFIDSDDEILAAIFSEVFTSENRDMRLVMDHSGKIQYYISVNNRADLSLLDKDLNNLWENFAGGRELSVRVATSDIGSKKRSCETCGINTVPYPLSTGRYCGDPLYNRFDCNKENGSLSFMTPKANYSVTRINPETLTFAVQVQDAFNCSTTDSAGKILQLNQSLPFKLSSGCNESSNSTLDPVFEDILIKEIEIRWDPPLEPICSSPEDCTDWEHTTCKVSGKGDSKCLCNEPYRWDPANVNCTSGTSEKKKNKSSYLIFLGIIATIIVILCITCSVFFLKRRRVANRQDNRGSNQGSIALPLYDTERRVKDFIDLVEFREEDKKGIDVPCFDLASILAATDNLSEANKLGQGGFGPVYKGKFPGGQLIAIKRLSRGSGQGLEEFKNEVVLIAKLQHRNLVRLLGYCIDRDEKMLLYEYMSNKSLDSFLFDRTLCVLLNWEIRFNIILGIARGLLYLHQDSRLRIIHRDLKTSNILLDEEMNPKISDFGLARIFGGKQTEGSTTRVVGTYGYMSPEYALDGYFSIKSDAFSFGVVILEVISGKRNTGFFHSEQALISLLGYAWKSWKEDKALDLMDPTLRESCNTNEFLRCVNVGLLCVQEDPSDRPTMSNAVFMLGGETATLPTPKQPAFVVRRSVSSSKPDSLNALTATIEEGR